MGQLICKSDLLDVRINHVDTRVITYSNSSYYAGLYFDRTQVFSIRVFSKFFEERSPETNESEPLTDGSIVKLASSVKRQQLLEVEAAPGYFHQKIQLALQHNVVSIDLFNWEKEEPYVYTKMNDRYPFYLGNTWLTHTDIYDTNVYGPLNIIPPPADRVLWDTGDNVVWDT